MRTIKLSAIALLLALTGAVYAAGARQSAARSHDTTKAEKSCCQKHAGAQASTHGATRHDGEGCCAGGCCSGACPKDHKGHEKASAQEVAAPDDMAD